MRQEEEGCHEHKAQPSKDHGEASEEETEEDEYLGDSGCWRRARIIDWGMRNIIVTNEKWAENDREVERLARKKFLKTKEEKLQKSEN